jgi:hypothetical protein
MVSGCELAVGRVNLRCGEVNLVELLDSLRT